MKCRTCLQDGFNNPREIVKHKPSCPGPKAVEPSTLEQVVTTQMESQPVPQETAPTPNPEVEALIQKKLEESPDVIVKVSAEFPQEVNMSDAEAIQADPIPLEITPVDPKVFLAELFNKLKTQEGKSVISNVLSEAKYSGKSPEELFQELFTRIPDGDERVILRQFFQL